MEADVQLGVSRIETLQMLLSQHGAPGSLGCSKPNGDLKPVFVAPNNKNNDDEQRQEDDTPELISNFLGSVNDDYYRNMNNLHPHLYPLAQSKTSGNFICALRRAYADDAAAVQWYDKGDNKNPSSKEPWPIVEAKIGGPGMRLLALNSEHLMRRIVCECDFAGERTDLIDMYNEPLLKKKNANDDDDNKALDEQHPYEPGSVEKLGYVTVMLTTVL